MTPDTPCHSRFRCPVGLAAAVLVLSMPCSGRAVTWPFVRYTEAEGAPTGVVMGVAQDDSAYIWFATRAGMVRYDGASWITHDTKHGLPVAWQRDVVVDHEGTVWALAQASPVRVSRLIGQRWETLPYWTDVAAGMETFELVAGHDGDGDVALAVLAQGGRVGVWSRAHWWNVELPPQAGLVYSLAWHRSDLLIATAGGLLRLPDPGRPDAGPATPVPGLPEGPAYAAVLHPVTGTLHVVGRGWFGKLTPTGLLRQAGADSLRVVEPNFGVEAALDALGGLYLGTVRRLQYLHPQLGIEHLTSESGLVSLGLSDIMVDREGTVWIANVRGVNKLASRHLRSLGAADGLLKEEVSAILERRDGSIVFGHEGGLTFPGTPTLTLPLTAPGQEWSRAMDLYEDPTGALWVAMDRSGLARLGPAGDIRWHDGADGLVGSVYTVLHGGDGELWVGTATGLYRRHGNRFGRVDLFDRGEGRQPVVRRLHVAGDGALLVATTTEGVFRVHDGQVVHWRGEEPHGHGSAFALFEPTAGEVWVGTTGGLSRVRDGRLEPTTAPEPVIGEPVYAIMRDRRGRIWFGTGAGVLVWDGHLLRRFGVADGLAGAEVNRDALICDAENRVWIGTNGGVSVFDERLRVRSRADLLLWLDAIELDSVRHPPSVELRVPPSAHELVVRFAAPAFRDEARLRFTTYLEGGDAGWSTPATNPARSIRYTNLRPGRYRFHARAIDIDGRGSRVASTDWIVVAPPLHARPWFAVLAACALVGLVWLVGSLVQGRRYARRLSAEVALRTEELASSEAAVRAESRRLGAVLASISDGVVALDGAWTISLANPAAAALVGRAGSGLAGMPLEACLPGLGAAARRALAGVDTTGSPGTQAFFEYLLRGGEHGQSVLECAAAPLAAGGPGGGMVIAFRDTTERRRAAQAALRSQKLESLGVLAGGIAHDFNNLLTVIMGNATLLEMDCTGRQRPPLEQIVTASERARRLTAQLLTFARGGSPQRHLVDLRALVREASELAIAGTNVSLELDLADELWCAEVDAGQLEQVISNLLINARQAMPDGGRVWVTARNAALTGTDGDSGRQVEIRIRDEGCGIDRGDLERIFEPYFTTKDTGTGLGLAITHSVIERHGGSLRVTSEAGSGTEFTVLLPASREEPVSLRKPDTPDAAPGYRLLVMDDEEPVRDLLVRLLTRQGHLVTAVADGRQVLDAWSAAAAEGRPFHAAIMDLTVPGGMGGREAMARLREMDPAARAIVTSGYSHDPVMSDHGRHGFAAKLSKPFNGDDVARALRAACGDA
ncbi:MAG: response regulator [bacterium]|nr:response regulator [bacterium]